MSIALFEIFSYLNHNDKYIIDVKKQDDLTYVEYIEFNYQDRTLMPVFTMNENNEYIDLNFIESETILFSTNCKYQNDLCRLYSNYINEK